MFLKKCPARFLSSNFYCICTCRYAVIRKQGDCKCTLTSLGFISKLLWMKMKDKAMASAKGKEPGGREGLAWDVSRDKGDIYNPSMGDRKVVTWSGSLISSPQQHGLYKRK